MTVVITGARGLLGGAVRRHLQGRIAVIGWSHVDGPGFTHVDLTAPADIEAALDTEKPDIVIHCAANPNVAACEADPEAAREINARATARLVDAAARRDIRVAYVSTDYVFAGDRPGGYTEEDVPDPLQVYGRTKLEGEEYCLGYGANLVIRVPILFGIGYVIEKSTFPLQISRALRAGEVVTADDVEIRQPTLTDQVAQILWSLIELEASGIVHIAPQVGATKYQWAREIAVEIGVDLEMIHPSRSDPDSQRPVRSWLLADRLRQFGLQGPDSYTSTTSTFLRTAGVL